MQHFASNPCIVIHVTQWNLAGYWLACSDMFCQDSAPGNGHAMDWLIPARENCTGGEGYDHYLSGYVLDRYRVSLPSLAPVTMRYSLQSSVSCSVFALLHMCMTGCYTSLQCGDYDNAAVQKKFR